jgi:hypothetical protein
MLTYCAPSFIVIYSTIFAECSKTVTRVKYDAINAEVQIGQNPEPTQKAGVLLGT